MADSESSTPTQREEDLFDCARQITDAKERERYLEGACDGDPSLRRRIEDLLKAEKDADAFFDLSRVIG